MCKAKVVTIAPKCRSEWSNPYLLDVARWLVRRALTVWNLLPSALARISVCPYARTGNESLMRLLLVSTISEIRWLGRRRKTITNDTRFTDDEDR